MKYYLVFFIGIVFLKYLVSFTRDIAEFIDSDPTLCQGVDCTCYQLLKPENHLTYCVGESVRVYHNTNFYKVHSCGGAVDIKTNINYKEGTNAECDIRILCGSDILFVLDSSTTSTVMHFEHLMCSRLEVTKHCKWNMTGSILPHMELNTLELIC